jgi:hypothetical protein
MIPVIYILGYPRSGTTILGSLLGEADGAFHAGEVRFVWKNTLIDGRRRCGCRKPVLECGIWGQVLAEVAIDVLGREPVNFRDLGIVVHRWQREGVWPGTERDIIRGTLRGQRAESAVRYASALASLYRHTVEATGASVLIDSSKWAADAAILSSVQGIRPFILHVTRDPRGISLSRRKKLRKGHGPVNILRRRWTAAADAFEWNRVTRLCETLTRERPNSVSIRYEDLMADPRSAISEMRRSGLSIGNIPFSSDRTIFLRPNHTLGGNHSRFNRGETTLVPDTDWRSSLGPVDAAVVSAVTWSVRHRYGYHT